MKYTLQEQVHTIQNTKVLFGVWTGHKEASVKVWAKV